MTPEECKARLRRRGICVIIPTYNNCRTVADVVRGAQTYCQDVIVVDDGSTDGTNEILSHIEGIQIVTYKDNRGKGYALKRGFRHATLCGHSYAITMDADGQHYATDIPTFLRANIDHPGALIVGNRHLEGVDRNRSSSFANKFSNFWFAVQTLQRLPDTQTGYRLYPLKKISRLGLALLTHRYEAELELLVFAAWHGTKLVSTDVDVYYPPRNERVSHFRPAYDFARISLLNTILCVLAVVYALPLAIARLTLTIVRSIYSLLFFTFFSTIVLTPIVWLRFRIGGATEAKRTWLHNLIYRASRFIMIRHGIPGVKLSVENADESLFYKPHIVICNHQSHLDLMCLLILSPRIVFLTNDWVWNNPLYGVLIRNAEYYPASRGLSTITPDLNSLADRGYSTCIFPEGTRSADCHVLRFHRGAFHVAEELGLDILPIFIYGPGKVLPKHCRYLRRWPIHIEVGQVISRDELNAIGTPMEQATALRRRYKEWYERAQDRIEQDV